MVHLGKQNRTALDSLVLLQLQKNLNITKTDARVTPVHHLHNNEAVWLPVDNMRRCLLNPYLYPLLGLGRCYFLEQYPREQTRDFITLKHTVICLTQSAN